MKPKPAKTIQLIALSSITLVSIVIVGFALISGTEEDGISIGGILRNSPNAIPWVILLLISLYSWIRKRLGGILLILFGLAATYFFNFSGENFFLLTFILCLSIVLFGIVIVATEFHLRKNRSRQQ